MTDDERMQLARVHNDLAHWYGEQINALRELQCRHIEEAKRLNGRAASKLLC